MSNEEQRYYLRVSVDLPASVDAKIRFGRVSLIERSLVFKTREDAVNVLDKILISLGESISAGNAYISSIVDDIQTFCLELYPKLIEKAENFYVSLDFQYALIEIKLVPCKTVNLEDIEAWEPSNYELHFYNLGKIREFVK